MILGQKRRSVGSSVTIGPSLSYPAISSPPIGVSRSAEATIRLRVDRSFYSPTHAISAATAASQPLGRPPNVDPFNAHFSHFSQQQFSRQLRRRLCAKSFCTSPIRCEREGIRVHFPFQFDRRRLAETFAQTPSARLVVDLLKMCRIQQMHNKSNPWSQRMAAVRTLLYCTIVSVLRYSRRPATLGDTSE